MSPGHRDVVLHRAGYPGNLLIDLGFEIALLLGGDQQDLGARFVASPTPAGSNPFLGAQLDNQRRCYDAGIRRVAEPTSEQRDRGLLLPGYDAAICALMPHLLIARDDPSAVWSGPFSALALRRRAAEPVLPAR